MTDRELLQDALDALSNFDKGNHGMRWQVPLIKALRARLSQPEPEPVAWGLQQQFEGKIGTAPVAFKRHDEFGFVVPLYTAPPPREWVGLTDEELHALHFELKVQTMGGMNTLGMYRILEKALREKNHAA